MIALIVIISIIFGMLRVIDGDNSAPRPIQIIGSGITLILFYNITDIYLLVSLIISLLIGYNIGWGKYLTATGLGKWNKNEKEFPPIDIIVNKIDHPVISPVLGMSLRWLLFAPVFIICGQYYEILGLLLIGPIYYLYRYLSKDYKEQKWEIIEFISGSLLGFLLVI